MTPQTAFDPVSRKRIHSVMEAFPRLSGTVRPTTKCCQAVCDLFGHPSRTRKERTCRSKAVFPPALASVSPSLACLNPGQFVENDIVVSVVPRAFTTLMPKIDQIRVLVVDDHPVVRAGLASMLSCYPELEVANGVAGGAAALATIKKSRVDVVLLDLRMPEMSGLETLQAIRTLESPPK